MTADSLATLAVWAVPLLFAVILHEIAHGWVAYRLGDPTAKEAGRLTLNPLPHIDPFGTVLLPALLVLAGSPFLFGYARPVPVNFMRLRRPKSDMVLVAAAGPLTNFALAAISAVMLHSVGPEGGLLTSVLLASVLINVILAVFNLFPVPPLDGGRVAVGLLPMPAARALARVEPFGILAVFFLLASGNLGWLMRPVVNGFLDVLL